MESNNNTRDPNNRSVCILTLRLSLWLKGGIAQYVLSSADGGARLDDKAILQYGVSQIVAGTKTVEQAAEEIQRFYWEGTKFQDQSYHVCWALTAAIRPVARLVQRQS